MAVWRCPHCATPQPEASRCWVCRRSTTCCATCRHFRRGVAAGLGVCGLEARRPVLDGTEMRACWVAAPLPPDTEGGAVRPATGVMVTWIDEQVGHKPRTFVPVEPSGPVAVAVLDATAVEVADDVAAPGTQPAEALDPAPAAPAERRPARPIPGRWWLWGDPEPWPEP